MKNAKASCKKQRVFIKVNMCPWRKKKGTDKELPTKKGLKITTKETCIYEGEYINIKGKKKEEVFNSNY